MPERTCRVCLRFLYLVHCFMGKVSVAIEACYAPTRSWVCRSVARSFCLAARSFPIAASWVDWGQQSSRTDADTLSGLPAIRVSWKTAQEQECSALLNSLAKPEQLAKELQQALQLKWAENVDGLIQNGREPRIGELTEFGSSLAKIARSRFVQLAESSKKYFRSGSTSNWGIARQPRTSNCANLMTHDNKGRPP